MIKNFLYGYLTYCIVYPIDCKIYTNICFQKRAPYATAGHNPWWHSISHAFSRPYWLLKFIVYLFQGLKAIFFRCWFEAKKKWQGCLGWSLSVGKWEIKKQVGCASTILHFLSNLYARSTINISKWNTRAYMKIKFSITSKIAWDPAMNWYFDVFSI